MKLIVKQDFRWAHRGVDVKQYEEDDEIETDDLDLIEVSTTEGWTMPADGETLPPLRTKRRSVK
jgi:hypothetical protein